MSNTPGRSASLCLCGSGKPAEKCCLPIIRGIATADTAETLMRSRYTAYCVKNAQYLLDTWDKSTSPDTIDVNEIPKWVKLNVTNTHKGDISETEGVVEFSAIYIHQNHLYTHHEISRFEKIDERWIYLSGEVIEGTEKPVKIGKNEPCPCGSEKKFKRCCLSG